HVRPERRLKHLLERRADRQHGREAVAHVGRARQHELEAILREPANETLEWLHHRGRLLSAGGSALGFRLVDFAHAYSFLKKERAASKDRPSALDPRG